MLPEVDYLALTQLGRAVEQAFLDDVADYPAIADPVSPSAAALAATGQTRRRLLGHESDDLSGSESTGR